MKEKRVAELEMLIFGLSMKDRWTPADYDKNKEWKAELAALKRP